MKRSVIVLAALVAASCASPDEQRGTRYTLTFSGDVIWTKEGLDRNEELNAAKFCAGGPWRHIKTTREADGRTATITFECIGR